VEKGSLTNGTSNWIETVPGKSWFVILRLYGPLEPWFDKTWQPGEIELMEMSEDKSGNYERAHGANGAATG